jgi:hypothetical protein
MLALATQKKVDIAAIAKIQAELVREIQEFLVVTFARCRLGTIFHRAPAGAAEILQAGNSE